MSPLPPMATETVHIPQTGVTAELYRAAIGPRGQGYYLRQFAKFDANGKPGATWHWPAYWATLNWLIYRRMWGWALAYAAALLGLGLVVFGVGKLVFGYSDAIGILMFLLFLTAAFILPGLYANAWFYNDCNEKISAALRSTEDIKDACDVLSAQASNDKRWFTIAAVNVALMALVAGLTAFVLNPAPEGPALAQSQRDRAGAVSPTLVTQPVVAPASEAGSASLPVPLPLPGQPPTATVSEAAPQPSAPVKPEPVAAKAADSPAPKSLPITEPARPEPRKPEPTRPVQVAAASADEPVAPVPAAQPAPKPEVKPAPKPAVKPAAKAAPKPRKPAAPKVKHVWLIQVGAFANESNVQNVRARIEEVGLQTSAEPSDTASGRLTRVRVGPFDTKAEADKAAMRLKALDLPTVLIRQ